MQFAARSLIDGNKRPSTGPMELMSSLIRRSGPRDETVLAHFFNARATENLEKSTEGMYRTMLTQLLQHLSPHSIQELTANWPPFERINWDLDRLTHLFEAAIRKHKKQTGRPVTCFIDALDECDEKQTQEMISTFYNLLERARAEDTRLRFCFASRHYGNLVKPAKSLTLVIEGQQGHTNDIKTFIDASLHINDSILRQRAQALLQENARGTFIWCVLVVEILNKRYSQGQLGRNPEALEEIINSIPSKLHDLFGSILGLSGENGPGSDDTILCL